VTVLVERAFDEPVELEALQRREHEGAWCLEAHSVRFLRTFVAHDRRRLLCLYDAPDAESVRLAQRKAGMPFDLVWSARRIGHAAAAGSGQAVVVERLLPRPFSEMDVQRAFDAKAWCLDLYRCRAIESYLSADGTRMVCRFEAPDAESVRQAQRVAALPLTATWSATVHEA
jgi:hypothetical protein